MKAEQEPGQLFFDGPATARRTIVLAHGAGAGMDRPFLAGMAKRVRRRASRFPSQGDLHRCGRACRASYRITALADEHGGQH